MAKYQQLSPQGLAIAGAVTGFVLWLAGLVWHGGMGMPTMMGVPFAVPYLMPMLQAELFVSFVIGLAVLGWITAAVYNWAIRT
ncbi:MAG TPA: hypothetical protein VJB16_02900 [archaeon]|nr:hypothetical protein [archaeon]